MDNKAANGRENVKTMETVFWRTSDEVNEIPVIEETDKTATVKFSWGDTDKVRKAAMDTPTSSFFTSRELAISTAVEVLERYVRNRRAEIEDAEKRIAKYKALAGKG